MRTVLTLVLLLGLGSLPALAGESEQVDHERPLVQQGVRGRDAGRGRGVQERAEVKEMT